MAAGLLLKLSFILLLESQEMLKRITEWPVGVWARSLASTDLKVVKLIWSYTYHMQNQFWRKILKSLTAVFDSSGKFFYFLIYRDADKSLARPERKQATATEDFDIHISYL